MNVSIINNINNEANIALLNPSDENLKKYLSEKELTFVEEQLSNDIKYSTINQYNKYVFIINIESELDSKNIEKSRKQGSKLFGHTQKLKIDNLTIISEKKIENKQLSAFVEGFLLSNYKFDKYLSEKDEKNVDFLELNIFTDESFEKDLEEIKNLKEAVFITRNLTNEPYISLNSLQLAEKIELFGKDSGYSVKILHKKQIEALKMGGLLAVNMGSDVPPTFSILEWKPENPVNKKPIILVGKGIVFDTGGMSLKPPKSMIGMKMDMGGAASVTGAMYAIAKNKLNVHVIALVPSTDNAADAKSYVPGDVIKMHSGLFVEVLNTDAEGRLILADALSYAKKFDPELVLDLATLTGAAVVAVGELAAAVMGTASDDNFKNLETSGFNTYERVVRLPIWDEYKELIKSDIADIKNISSGGAGTITAGKFLECFTDYPWIHIDIAGPAMLSKNDAYRPKGASGYGVRLIYDFIKNFANKND